MNDGGMLCQFQAATFCMTIEFTYRLLRGISRVGLALKVITASMQCHESDLQHYRPGQARTVAKRAREDWVATKAPPTRIPESSDHSMSISTASIDVKVLQVQ